MSSSATPRKRSYIDEIYHTPRTPHAPRWDIFRTHYSRYPRLSTLPSTSQVLLMAESVSRKQTAKAAGSVKLRQDKEGSQREKTPGGLNHYFHSSESCIYVFSDFKNLYVSFSYYVPVPTLPRYHSGTTVLTCYVTTVTPHLKDNTTVMKAAIIL